MIFAKHFTYGFLALLAIAGVAAVAQPAKDAVEPIKAEPREPREPREITHDADVQQRRALLRASLKSQPDLAMAREASANPSRQLSDQERADLRHQLRQQERQQ